ncbi:MAG: hemolysin family protein [Gemmatimonadales bacterium]
MIASGVIAPVVTVGATLWAGLLVMAQVFARPGRTVADSREPTRTTIPLAGAVRVSRLALLIVAGTAGSEIAGWWYRPWLEGIARIVIILALIYLGGEAIPRGVALLAPGLARAVADVARRTLVVFSPLFGAVTAAGSAIDALIPPAPKRKQKFGKAHKDMLQGIFSLNETSVSEAMTPRLDIVALESSATWSEVVEFLGRSDHARIPVYEDDLDSICGIIHAKDMTPAVNGSEAPPERWQDLIRPAQFVPESKSLTAQLRDFQRGAGRIAIVVDEFGGTSGLITREDILEEVVGEIHDEYDAEEEPIVREGADRFWVDGSVALDELVEELGVAVEREDVTTVGGLVYSELGQVPKPGQELQIGGFRVVVEQVIRRRIMRVYFERVAEHVGVKAAKERAK